MKQWYQKLFSNYSKKYEEEHFTQGTMGEVDFMEKEISFNKNFKILDIGCGTGRHAIELTKRGYNVTGVDLSEGMINKARKNAKKEDLEVDFRIADARNLSFKEEFDLVIMICEGAFPLMETDEMNFQILKNSANALKNSGKIIFTTLNGLYPLFHSVKDFINSNSTTSIVNNYTFNLMTFRDHYKLEIENDHGENLSLDCNERYYVPSEITWLLKSLNFTEIDIFSCKLGEFNKDPLTTEDYEMLVVAKL